MRVAGRADLLIYILSCGAGAGGLRSVRAVGRAGYEKKLTRASLRERQGKGGEGGRDKGHTHAHTQVLC